MHLPSRPVLRPREQSLPGEWGAAGWVSSMRSLGTRSAAFKVVQRADGTAGAPALHLVAVTACQRPACVKRGVRRSIISGIGSQRNASIDCCSERRRRAACSLVVKLIPRVLLLWFDVP